MKYHEGQVVERFAEQNVAVITDSYLQRGETLTVYRYGKEAALVPAAHEPTIRRNCDILCCFLLGKPMPRNASEELAIGLLVEMAMRDWLRECLLPLGLRVCLVNHILDSVTGEAGSDLIVSRDDGAVILLIDVSSKKKFYDKNAWSSWLGVPIMHWYVGSLKLPVRIKRVENEVGIKAFVRDHWRPAVLYGRVAAPDYYPARDTLLREKAQAAVTESFGTAVARFDQYVLQNGTETHQEMWRQHRAILLPDQAEVDVSASIFLPGCFQMLSK